MIRLQFVILLLVTVVASAISQIRFEQAFESSTFPPTGWVTEYSGTLYWERANTGGYSASTHSASFLFYDASEFEIQSIVSSTFAATGVNDSLTFDHAYATFLDEVDSLIIDVSSDGGSSFARLVALEGGPTVGVGMVTALPKSGPFVPLSNEWGTKRYALPAGTNRLKFTAKSAYGNNLYLDNIRVGQSFVNDVGIQEILYPSVFVNIPFARAPKAIITNFGTAGQATAFNITMSITGPGGFAYSNTKSDTVSANSSHQVVFDSTFNPAAPGLYAVTCYTDLTGEQFRGNDTLRLTVSGANANYGTNGSTGSLLYYFTNSLAGSGAPAQPQFGWKDTTGSIDLIVNGAAVAPLTGDLDDGFFTLTNLFPGRNFELFGIPSDTTVFVSTNGLITFGEGTIEYLPTPLPSGVAPNDAIYALWADFDFSDPDVPVNRLSYKVDGDLLIVTYDRAPRYNSDADPNDFVTFQVCLRFAVSRADNSFVLVQYDQAHTGSAFIENYNGNTFPHLVGIENLLGTESVTYRYANGSTEIVHGPLFGSSLAVTFGPSYESQVTINAKAFLEGSYSTLTHNMRTNIRPLLPLAQPYTTGPWDYTGSENTPSVPDSVVDWILAELQDSAGSSSLAARRVGFIKQTGAIRSVDGAAPIVFDLMKPGSYYVVLRHRNHLPIMSATSISLGLARTVYDFSTAQSQAYGTLPMNQLEAGVFGMVAGDVNRSMIVTASDANSVFSTLNSQGYAFEDANMSGIVTAADANSAFGNLNRSTQIPAGIQDSAQKTARPAIVAGKKSTPHHDKEAKSRKRQRRQ